MILQFDTIESLIKQISSDGYIYMCMYNTHPTTVLSDKDNKTQIHTYIRAVLQVTETKFFIYNDCISSTPTHRWRQSPQIILDIVWAHYDIIKEKVIAKVGIRNILEGTYAHPSLELDGVIIDSREVVDENAP